MLGLLGWVGFQEPAGKVGRQTGSNNNKNLDFLLSRGVGALGGYTYVRIQKEEAQVQHRLV